MTKEQLKKEAAVLKRQFNVPRGWLLLASHIRWLILVAKIEEQNIYAGKSKYGYDCGLDATRRIAELKAELERLEP